MKHLSILFIGLFVSVCKAQIPTYLPTNGLQGWWPFCGNANDESGNAHHGTPLGATLTTDRFGNTNNAYFFNGSSYIATTYAGVLGANKRAVSFWAKTSDATNPMTGVSWGKSESFPNTGKKFGCEFNVFSSGLTIDGADCAVTYNSPTSHANNVWHHYVYQMDNAALLNQVQIYMDGVLASSVATDFRGTSTMITLQNYNVWFGKMDNGLPYYFNGSLDDIAIWNRTLTQTEITSLYNSSPPCVVATPTVNLPSCVSTSSLIGWWPFCGNANDESGNTHHGTPIGATLTTDRFGNTNSAYSLNGITNSIFVNDNFFDAGWNEFTISGWYYFNVLTNTNNFNVNQTLINTAPHHGLGISSNWGGTPKHGMLAGNGTPATSWNVMPLITSTQTVTVGAWKHFVYTKSGLNYSFYIDGVLDKTTTASISVTSYLYKMYFGNTDPATINEGVLGKIDDYGIWNRTLTQTEITALYNCTASCVTNNTVTPTPTITPTSTISVLPLPNVLTPNNDGVNDYIDFTKHIAEKDFDFEIFNRWGLSILKSNSNSKTIWDGTTSSGQPCVDGVYFYIIKTTDKSYKGNITLFR